MKTLKFLIPVGLFVILAGFLFKGLYLDPREVPSPLIDKPAPEFALTQLDKPEQTIRRTDMLGKVWMLNVWASWCEACRDEHPYLVEFARTKALPIYGLDYKDQREPAQAWLSERGNPYDASLFDQSGRVGIDFGVYGVPETFVIDKQGVIRFKQIGALTPQVLNDKVLPLLRKLNGDARRLALAALLAGTLALRAFAAEAPASAPAASAAASDAVVKYEAPTARLTAADPALEARMLAITGELRCLVCQNQTIADSHADLAVDLRQQVREMLQKGQTPDQIRRYMTDRYGDFVLYRPPWKATTAVLWLAPATLLAIALLALAVVIRRRARLADDQFEPEPMLDDDAAEPLDRPGTLA